MRDRLNRLVDELIAVAFPARCAGCGHRGTWVCEECLPQLNAIDAVACVRCGVPIGARCQCDEVSDDIAMCRSAARYDGWLRQAIHLLKYEGEPARAASLAPLLFAPAGTFPEFDVIAPAPLHPSRQRRRGYNQAELLAAPLAAHMGRPVRHCLERTRPTTQQVGLNGDARRRNVAGAFAVALPDDVAGKRVLLVDDVMTTGATLNACAEVLHSAGAAWIGVLTLTRDL